MAFDPLATTDDLDNRGITVPASMDADAILGSASDAVREAAGCAISQATSVVDLIANDRESLDLPGVPVTAVASVLVEGVAVAASTLTAGRWSAGWRRSGNRILFKGQHFETPATVTVTYTHGFAAVPTDIVDLACGVAAMKFAAEGAYGSSGLSNEIKLGDYLERFNHPAGSESPSPGEIPDAVRQRLRARFGTSVATLRMR